MSDAFEKNKPNLKSAMLYFLKLGATEYGGSYALAEKMRLYFVEEMKWIDAHDFEKGFSLSQILPGPLAAKLSVYLAYRLFGVGSSALLLFCFIIPSVAFIFTFGFLYSTYGSVAEFKKIALALTPIVLGLTLFSICAPSQRQIRKDPKPLLLLFSGATFAGSYGHINIAVVFIIGGLIFALLKNKFETSTKGLFGIAPGLAITSDPLYFKHQSTIFFESLIAGSIIFGGGNAIIPFFKASFVDQYALLTMRQFLDGLALGLLTPGPALVAATFFGTIAGGPLGGVLATIAVFVPCLIMVIAFTPFNEKMMKNLFFKNFSLGATVCAL